MGVAIQGNRLSSKVADSVKGSDAPIAPEKLIQMTLDYSAGLSLEEQAKMLDEDYVFRGPGTALASSVFKPRVITFRP